MRSHLHCPEVLQPLKHHMIALGSICSQIPCAIVTVKKKIILISQTLLAVFVATNAKVWFLICCWFLQSMNHIIGFK